MKFGIAMFPADYAIRPDALAAAVEERGFDSLFFPEHTHLPASEAARSQTSDLPDYYARTYDLFTAMSYAAAATKTLLIGSGICLLPQHEPIVAAKAIASIDHLSDGRVLFGIGAGWIFEELDNFGFDPAERWAVMKDRMLAMKAIWSNDIADYQGKYRQFGPIYSWPKPTQAGGPPILIGGMGPNVLKRVADYGDGWMPNDRLTTAELKDRMSELQEEGAKCGRTAPLTVSIFGAKQDPAHLTELAEAGVDRVLLYVQPAERGEAIRQLDEFAVLRDQVTGSN